MGIHEWSYDNAIAADHRYRVPLKDTKIALKSIKIEVELGFDPKLAFAEAQRCLNCDVQTVFTDKPLHRVRRLRRHLPDGLHHLHRERRRARPARAAARRRRTRRRTSTCRARSRPAASWSRTRTSACTAACAPSAARPARGTCRSSCSTWRSRRPLPRAQRGRGLPVAAVLGGWPGNDDERVNRIARINDFVVKFANVNGSGSASANALFASAILRMGVPVAARNIFPSNIQGLPTWYEVRVVEAGWRGRRGGVDLMVAMNPQTWDKDVAEIEPGGYLFYDSTKPLPTSKFRDDVHVIGMPLTAICNAEYTDARQRQLFKNIIYLGALAALLDIDAGRDREADRRAVQGQGVAARGQPQGAAHGPRLRAANLAARSAAGAARATRSATASSSTATAPRRWAAFMAARRSARGTRSRRRRRSPSVPEALPQVPRRPGDRQAQYAIVQAEDELASIGIVIGAAWNGARAFTATSGPGISLMQEFIGLAYFAEIPAVIFDVQRGSPSTGMPTRTQQADLLSCAYASHGDTKHVLLSPRIRRSASRWAAGARPRRPAADAGLRPVRPRHRHAGLAVPSRSRGTTTGDSTAAR